jgi:hypothetical protein
MPILARKRAWHKPQVAELVPTQRGWLEQLTVRSPRGRARAIVQANQARSM